MDTNIAGFLCWSFHWKVRYDFVAGISIFWSYKHLHNFLCLHVHYSTSLNSDFLLHILTSFCSIGQHYTIYATPSSPEYYQYTFDNSEDFRSVTLHVASTQDHFCTLVSIQEAKVCVTVACYYKLTLMEWWWVYGFGCCWYIRRGSCGSVAVRGSISVHCHCQFQLKNVNIK